MRTIVGTIFLALPFLLVAGSMYKFVGPYFEWHLVVTALFATLFGSIATYVVTRSQVVFTCPENTAYLGVNLLTKGLFVLKQGFNFKYPWDEVAERNKFVLDLRNIVCVKDGETRERALVKVTLRVAYKPDPRSVETLQAYNALGGPSDAEKKIKEALDAALGTAILAILPSYTLDTFRTSVDKIKRQIIENLDVGNSRQSPIERRFGCEILDVEIGDMTVPQGGPTEKVNALVAKLAVYQKKSQEMANDLKISPQKAFELILLADPDSQALRIMGQSIGLVSTKLGDDA